MIIDATLYPGADAGLKIAAAIAALPSGTGGTVDARGFSSPQVLTGCTIPPGVTLLLGPIYYTVVSRPLTIQDGGRCSGGGTGSPGGTILKAANGFNQNVVECVSRAGKAGATWWHHGVLEWVRIDGNKAQNTTGHGIAIWGMGEVSQVRNCIVGNAANAGLCVHGSNAGTGTINNVTTNSNGQYGIVLDTFTSSLKLTSVGGDSNPILLGIVNSRYGGTIVCDDLKCETNGVGTEIVHISGGGGNSVMTLTFLGGNINCGSTLTTFLTIDANVQRANHKITIIGTSMANHMPTLIRDLKLQQTVSQPDGAVCHTMLVYDGGQSPPVWSPFPSLYPLTPIPN